MVRKKGDDIWDLKDKGPTLQRSGGDCYIEETTSVKALMQEQVWRVWKTEQLMWLGAVSKDEMLWEAVRASWYRQECEFVFSGWIQFVFYSE